jgi:beta-glucanase (GH16 family)
VQIDSNRTNYQYGTYGSRIKMANCAGQNRPGVVTGTFTYATNHADVNGNGLPDNDEIDIEVLCAQPYVLWLTIWTDYRDSDAAARKISRAINMRTGAVLYNCYVFRLGDNCQPAVAGENNPARVTAVPNYDSGTQFRSYFFDWQPNRVTFWGYDNTGAKNVLWDYTGPSSRIPKKPGMFMQNVWHTNNWDPLDGPAHNQPTASISAYVDMTVLPN